MSSSQILEVNLIISLNSVNIFVGKVAKLDLLIFYLFISYTCRLISVEPIILQFSYSQYGCQAIYPDKLSFNCRVLQHPMLLVQPKVQPNVSFHWTRLCRCLNCNKAKMAKNVRFYYTQINEKYWLNIINVSKKLYFHN